MPPLVSGVRLASLATKPFARRLRQRLFRFEFLQTPPIAGITLATISFLPRAVNSKLRIENLEFTQN